MFLKKVYRQSKWMFAGMLFFIAMQVLVSWKHGIVFTPWYNFGMYSSVILPKAEYNVLVAISGKDTLKGHDFSPPHWDRIMYTPVRMGDWQCRQHFFDAEVARLMNKAKLGKPNPSNFISRPGEYDLQQWYGQWVQQYFGLEQPVRLEQWRCSWDGRQLLPLSKNSNLIFDSPACR